MQQPAVHELAADAPIHRTVTHECTPDEFRPVARRIDAGLDWGVGAIVTDDRDRVLLVREHGRWQTPGGEVEAGESHGTALRREVEEETGLLVDPGDLVAVTENQYVCDDGRERAFAFAHYTASLVDGRSVAGDHGITDDPGLADEDIEAVEWRAELPPDTLQADVVRAALE